MTKQELLTCIESIPSPPNAEVEEFLLVLTNNNEARRIFFSKSWTENIEMLVRKLVTKH